MSDSHREPLIPEVMSARRRVTSPSCAPRRSWRGSRSAAWWRTTEWSIGASISTGNRVVPGASVSGQSPTAILSTLGSELRANARSLLGLVESPLSAMPGGSLLDRMVPPATGHRDPPPSTSVRCASSGAELLRAPPT